MPARRSVFYLLIGPDAIPHVRPSTTSKDSQARELSTATIDAIGGSKEAYGYLDSVAYIERDLFSSELKGAPSWLDQSVQ